MRKAIVTGATGLVGLSVARKLCSMGIDVLCLSRGQFSKDEAKSYFGNSAIHQQIAMEDIESLEKKIEVIGWLPDNKCVFYNFAWSGINNLTDGGFAVQLSSAIHAAHAVRVAKRIGCVKYVNAGTLGETYLERYLAGKNTKKYQSSQLDYSLAKLAGRDMCKMVAYLEKIDYVHTRMSIPLCPNLSRGSYVAQTLKKIIKGEQYSPPKDNYLFDIISTDDVAQAYYLLGNYGKNKADYFIGTSRPASLVDYFERCADQNNHTREGIFFSPLKDEIDLFSTESLFRDTNFVCTTDFEKIIVRLKSP